MPNNEAESDRDEQRPRHNPRSTDPYELARDVNFSRPVRYLVRASVADRRNDSMWAPVHIPARREDRHV